LNDPGKYLNINIFKKKEVLETKKVLFLHPNERFEKILKIHEENHRAYRHTLLKVQESFWWNGMSNDVKFVCQQCVECGMSSKKKSNYERIQAVTCKTSSYRFSMDLSFFNGSILFHLMNNFSRKVQGVLLPDKCSKTVKKALESIAEIAGNIDTLLSDCGTEFKGELAKWLKEGNYIIFNLEHPNIEVLRTMPHTPRQNGRVERFHRTVKKSLEIWASKNAGYSEEAFEEEYHRVLKNYNEKQIHSVLKMSPTQYEQMTTIPENFGSLVQKEQEEILAKIAYLQTEANLVHLKNIKKAEKARNKGRTEKELVVGNDVLIKPPPSHLSKYMHTWCKSGVIVEKNLQKNVFVVRFGPTGGWLKRHLPNTTVEIHDSHIKSKPLGVDITLERYGPLEMSTEDEEEIQVEEQTPQIEEMETLSHLIELAEEVEEQTPQVVVAQVEEEDTLSHLGEPTKEVEEKTPQVVAQVEENCPFLHKKKKIVLLHLPK
jgi:hypothetical protein